MSLRDFHFGPVRAGDEMSITLTARIGGQLFQQTEKIRGAVIFYTPDTPEERAAGWSGALMQTFGAAGVVKQIAANILGGEIRSALLGWIQRQLRKQ